MVDVSIFKVLFLQRFFSILKNIRNSKNKMKHLFTKFSFNYTRMIKGVPSDLRKINRNR